MMNQKQDKFQRYLRCYHRLVKSNARKYVDEQLSEDVTQETFLKVYEHLDYLEDNKIKSWLLVVSSNIARDYLKKGGVVDDYLIDPHELSAYMEDKFVSAETYMENVEKKEAARQLLRTACNLLYRKNPTWYYIMIDSCLLEMTSEQISKALNIPKGSVEVMKLRARKYLKERLGRKFHEYF